VTQWTARNSQETWLLRIQSHTTFSKFQLSTEVFSSRYTCFRFRREKCKGYRCAGFLLLNDPLGQLIGEAYQPTLVRFFRARTMFSEWSAASTRSHQPLHGAASVRACCMYRFKHGQNDCDCFVVACLCVIRPPCAETCDSKIGCRFLLHASSHFCASVQQPPVWSIL
jgi:hypothetical protein